jgi:hypothetical protein
MYKAQQQNAFDNRKKINKRAYIIIRGYQRLQAAIDAYEYSCRSEELEKSDVQLFFVGVKADDKVFHSPEH